MVSDESLLITLGAHVAYFILYSGYSKSLKTLDLRLLSDIFLVKTSWDHTLVQINKVVALVAINLVALAFVPFMSALRDDLLIIGLTLVLIHSSYSILKYYGTTNIPAIQTWPRMFSELMHTDTKKRGLGIKKSSLIFGWIGEMALLALVFGYFGI